MKAKKTMVLATVFSSTLMTGCMATLPGKDTFSQDGLKNAFNNFQNSHTDKATGLGFDKQSGQVRVSQTADACLKSDQTRGQYKALRQAQIDKKDAADKDASAMDTVKSWGKTSGTFASFKSTQSDFEKSTKACAQTLASDLNQAGKWTCAFNGYEVVNETTGKAPKSARECATSDAPTGAKNYLARWTQVNAGDYNTGGKYHKKPALIK